MKGAVAILEYILLQRQGPFLLSIISKLAVKDQKFSLGTFEDSYVFLFPYYESLRSVAYIQLFQTPGTPTRVHFSGYWLIFRGAIFLSPNVI